MTNRNLTPAASSAKDPLLPKKNTVRSFYAHAHCVFRSDVRLDVRFSLGRTFKRTFYLDKYVSIFDTDGLPYGSIRPWFTQVDAGRGQNVTFDPLYLEIFWSLNAIAV